MNALRQGHITVLIVDDEPLARDVLRTLFSALHDFAIIGEARDGREALATIVSERPHLICLDVQIPELDGIELSRAVAAGPVPRPAIAFVTAHDQFAVPAFDVEAIDYLVKPFTDERFFAMIARVRKYFDRESAVTARHQALRSSILVSVGGRSIVVATADIEWIGADGYCSRLHTPTRSYVVRKSLASLQRELGADVFVRVHRDALVRLDRVRALRRSARRGGEVIMASGATINVSERRRTELVRRLE